MAIVESKRAPEQIRIKTLEEIRQEKAAKSQSQNDDSSAVASEVNTTKTTKGVKRAITGKDSSIRHIKMFSEILGAKKKRQEEPEQNPSPKKSKHTVEKAPGKSRAESDPAGPGPEAEVRVKTLEEIRREKAAKLRAQPAPEAEDKKGSDTEANDVKKPRLLRIKKLPSQSKTALTLLQFCPRCVDTRNVTVVNSTVVNVFQIELDLKF